MSADILVRTTAAGVVYGSGSTARTALTGVNLEIVTRDHVALVGSSGSGKSTLLHVLAGLLAPTSGRVDWPGMDDPRTTPGAVATVFQAPSLITALTVVENVELPLLIEGQAPAAARRRADEALAALDLGFLRDRLPEELSGGQGQRVSVARVLAAGPTLILADEPTGQVDSVNGALVIDALVHAATVHGAALVVATHDPRVWRRFTRRLAVADGQVRAETVVDAS